MSYDKKKKKKNKKTKQKTKNQKQSIDIWDCFSLAGYKNQYLNAGFIFACLYRISNSRIGSLLPLLQVSSSGFSVI